MIPEPPENKAIQDAPENKRVHKGWPKGKKRGTRKAKPTPPPPAPPSKPAAIVPVGNEPPTAIEGESTEREVYG
jgi:hypothetical protein